MMNAAAFGHLEVVEILIRAGGDVNLTDQAQNSALSLSTKGGYANITAVLLAAGAVEQAEEKAEEKQKR